MTDGGQRSSKLWTLSHDVVEVRDGEERYSVPSSVGSSIPRQPSGHGKEKRWWRPVSTGCSVRFVRFLHAGDMLYGCHDLGMLETIRLCKFVYLVMVWPRERDTCGAFQAPSSRTAVPLFIC